MPKTIYEFNTPSNYTLNNAKIDGAGALDLIPHPNRIFSNTFDDDTGFTYDNSLSQFIAGILEQKDKTPAGSRLAALYDTTVNSNWNKDGTLAATLNGAPTIVTGRLQCFGAQGLSYSVTNSGVGAIKFKYKPNYTGSPSTNRNVIAIANTATGNSRIMLSHSPSGDNFRIFVTDSTGVVVFTATTIGGSNINLSAANTYEMELNWSNLTGNIRLFVNGALHGTLTAAPWTHGVGAASLYVGANALSYNTSNASYEDLVFFNSVQHTALYDPGLCVFLTFGTILGISGLQLTKIV